MSARLLIVDDEVAQMRALSDTLRVEGFRVQGFSSPRTALNEFRAGDFDLLLTDLMMPDMDGIDLIGALQSVDPSLGAIVMTGHGTIDTAVRAMQHGAFDYVLKPFKLTVILQVIARALEVQRLRRENAEFAARERQRAQELASAYKDLESFSYSISHDLRAPLRSIAGFAQALQEDHGVTLDEDGRRLIQVIRERSRHMDELIIGLLEFSRVGTAALKLAPIDMKSLAAQVAEEALGTYESPRPEVRIAELPVVMGDATVMRQVWSNLIGNALKYSAKRPSPKVEIAGRVEGGEAIFEVQDNGAGFDMRYADKLFGVFQRLHRREEFAGTGVGLSIVQRIVSRHGGRIWAEGKVNEGARFSFALPVG